MLPPTLVPAFDSSLAAKRNEEEEEDWQQRASYTWEGSTNVAFIYELSIKFVNGI